MKPYSEKLLNHGLLIQIDLSILMKITRIKRGIPLFVLLLFIPFLPNFQVKNTFFSPSLASKIIETPQVFSFFEPSNLFSLLNGNFL